MLIAIVCALTFLAWYPAPYFEALGAGRALRLAIGLILASGPLLTFIVFRPGKRGLAFDLVFIAVVQLGATAFSATTLFRGRPYFTVFAVDRFQVLTAAEVDAVGFTPARTAGRFGVKPVRGPLLVTAKVPSDAEGRQKLIEETVFDGKPDIEVRPEFWHAYAPEAVTGAPLAALSAARPEAAAAVAGLRAKVGVPETRLVFVPLIAGSRHLSGVVDRATGALVDVLEVDPWIDRTAGASRNEVRSQLDGTPGPGRADR